MKNEDIEDSLQMFDKQKQFEKQQKINEMEERDKRLEKMQKDKIKINLMKKKLNDDLQTRKIFLKNKVNNILTSGNYNNKDDIYKKVFSEDELSQMQLNIVDNGNDESKEIKEDDNKTNKSKVIKY